MKKEDFKYEDPEKYLENVYVYNNEKYTLVIEEDIFDDDAVKYAEKIADTYIKKKDDIITLMLDFRLREFYKEVYGYTDEYIRENIGRPQISIIFKNENNEKLKYKYFGVIEFLEHKLDEHIIGIEFKDDLELSNSVQMDG